MYHSQNKEAEYVVNYFGSYKGRLLDIGANDGITFSNSYDLIQIGWKGVLVEPSPKAWYRLSKLYSGVSGVEIVNCAITNNTGTGILFDSGPHIKKGHDIGIVSTMNIDETERWKETVSFTEETIRTTTYKDSGITGLFDFISIDCEGSDVDVLKQLDIRQLGCRCICVEHNSNISIMSEIISYCIPMGLKNILYKNAENIILTV